MIDDPGIGAEAVERFYARQRRDILALVAQEDRPSAGVRWLAGLAAAAVIVLGVATWLLGPPATSAGSEWITEVAEARAPLPLPAFGSWDDARVEDTSSEPAASWVLEDGTDDSTLPGFLEPYGAWTEQTEDEQT